MTKNVKIGIVTGVISGVILVGVISYIMLAASGCSILKTKDLLNIGVPSLCGALCMGGFIGMFFGNMRKIAEDFRSIKLGISRPRLKDECGEWTGWAIAPFSFFIIFAPIIVLCGLGYGIGWLAWVLFC